MSMLLIEYFGNFNKFPLNNRIPTHRMRFQLYFHELRQFNWFHRDKDTPFVNRPDCLHAGLIAHPEVFSKFNQNFFHLFSLASQRANG